MITTILYVCRTFLQGNYWQPLQTGGPSFTPFIGGCLRTVMGFTLLLCFTENVPQENMAALISERVAVVIPSENT